MNTLLQMIDSRTHNISAKSASVVTITMAVYNFVKGECIYYGDTESSRQLEATNSGFIAIPL